MATIVADSNSQADVQTAVTAATAGDTVIVPTTPSAGATWSSTVEVTKALTISGTGVTLTAGVEMTYGFFHLKDIVSDALVRITGFTFDNVTALAAGGVSIYFSGLSLTQLRIDHNTFHHGRRNMEIIGCKGLIDNNYFYNGNGMIYFTAGTRAQADASWVSMAAGTSDALFIEDNHFIYDANWTGTNGNDLVLDTYNGGKLVVRYNTVSFDDIPASWTDQAWCFQTHGSARGGAAIGYWQADATARRGQSVVEIYNNTVTGKNLARLVSLRGSANLVHDNSISSVTYGTFVYMYEEEQYEAQWSPLRTAWPAEDQIHNTFFWNNTFNGSAQAAENFVVGEESVAYIVQDRDYFLHRPATTGEGMTLGIETFTGANGGTNTYPTNGVVYATLGSMAFVADVENAYYGYVPYTYPHPLQGGAPTGPWVMIYG